VTEQISKIHTFLVKPNRGGGEEIRGGGAELPLEGDVFKMLNDIFTSSDIDCKIDISFNSGSNGEQENPFRSLLISYLADQSIETARAISDRLEKATPGQSGLGLLFLMTGLTSEKNKIVISRFPADNGILADETSENLTVQFLDRVFMKSARSYKAAAYSDLTDTSTNWAGRAVDKQMNKLGKPISDYWIREFLSSDFKTTSAYGTDRLASALKMAAQKTKDLDIRQEIAAAATLAPSLEGKMVNIGQIAETFGLSEKTQTEIRSALKNPGAYNENFEFSLAMFQSIIKYRTKILDNGGILTADADRFDKIFAEEVGPDEKSKFSTVGEVVNEKVGNRAQ